MVLEVIPTIGLAPVNAICAGKVADVVLPTPNWPEPFAPIAHTVPLFLITTVCWLPELTKPLAVYWALMTSLGLALPKYACNSWGVLRLTVIVPLAGTGVLEVVGAVPFVVKYTEALGVASVTVSVTLEEVPLATLRTGSAT